MYSLNKDIKKDAEKRKEAIYHAKLILSICLRDLIRQVSVQCVERGALIEKVLNNYINIFETENRGNMYDLDELQAKHLKDILKIKADGAKANKMGLKNKEVERDLRDQIDNLTEGLEQAKQEIEKLQEELEKKDSQNKEIVIQFKKRENALQNKFEKLKRRPYDMVNSTESEKSEEKSEPKLKRKRTIQKGKKVTRNDMLNLPSSDSEKIKHK